MLRKLQAEQWKQAEEQQRQFQLWQEQQQLQSQQRQQRWDELLAMTVKQTAEESQLVADAEMASQAWQWEGMEEFLPLPSPVDGGSLRSEQADSHGHMEARPHSRSPKRV